MKTLSVGCGSALPLEALCSLIIQGMDSKDAQQHLVEYYTKKTSNMTDNEKYLFLVKCLIHTNLILKLISFVHTLLN